MATASGNMRETACGNLKLQTIDLKIEKIEA
jgi:hypothetical protein